MHEAFQLWMGEIHIVFLPVAMENTRAPVAMALYYGGEHRRLNGLISAVFHHGGNGLRVQGKTICKQKEKVHFTWKPGQKVRRQLPDDRYLPSLVDVNVTGVSVLRSVIVRATVHIIRQEQSFLIFTPLQTLR